jgi:hypothetical protein
MRKYSYKSFQPNLNDVRMLTNANASGSNGERSTIESDTCRWKTCWKLGTGPGAPLVRRIDFCYTPKHGSWLNIAENELSSLTRQCVADRRFPDSRSLRVETKAWSSDVNRTQRGVDWPMKFDDARCKPASVYPNS